MKPASSSFKWPLRHLPLISTAGVFPMTVPDCNRRYAHQTIALHLHDYAGDMWIGDKRFRLQPGDMTFSPKSISTRYVLDSGGSHLCVHFFSPAHTSGKGAVHLPFHSRLGLQTSAARDRLWRVIDHFRRSGANPDSPAGGAASASLQELLLWLHLQRQRGATPQRSSLATEALARLLRAIDASLAKPMLIGELAAGVGLSSEYVARLFSKRYGMTLQRYLLLRRIELARHLLVSSGLLISAIGHQVGMPDPQYFNKQFRRVVGQSPLVYRRLHMAEPNPRRARKIS